jgi:PAS domain S-box-containing protein
MTADHAAHASDRSGEEARPRRDLASTLAGLVATAVDASGADAGALYDYDEDHGDLVLTTAHGLPDSALGHRLAMGEGLVGAVASEARSIASPDVAFDLRARRRRADWDAEPRARGFLGVPLRTGAVLIGVLELTSRRADAFTPEVRGHVAIFADAAALLIERTRLAAQPPPAALAGEPIAGDVLGVATLDGRLTVTSANAALCHLLGMPLEALVGRPVVAVLPALGRPSARDALQAALFGSAGHVGTVESTTGDGRHATLSVSLLPVGAGDRAEGAMLLAVDVTDRARLEAELREKHAQAVDARDRLRAVIEVVSHELRTPLTSVLGYAQLLDERPDAPPEQRRRWAGLAIEKARMMARLVSDVTDLARLGSARFELQPARGDLGSLVRRLAAEADAQAPAHRVMVTSDSVLPEVAFDADRIEQVVSNLLSNAIKHWSEGGTVDVTVSSEGEHVRVEVADRGPGIPEEALARVFEPFYRAGKAVGGSGLGLAIAKGIVEAHGGEIEARPRPGGGTVLAFSLPAKKA